MLHAEPKPTDDLNRLLQAHAQVQRFDEATKAWHENDTGAHELLLRLHRANFDLWHLEDRARDTQATDAVIASVKRSIDRTNQHRNDLVEQVDAMLMAELCAHGLPNPDAALHSETPGMMLDRLSILSLKRFHTEEQVDRADASAQHRERAAERLRILQAQSDALTGCLQHLWQEVIHGTRRFALYRQMKMYNDPTLNPVLYGAQTRRRLEGS